MAQAQQPTLGELRISVLKRCGLASEGNIPRNIQDIIDEKLRSAQKILYEKFPWIRTYVRREFPLIADNTDYDVPDDTESGNITWIAVQRIQDGWLFELERGIRPEEMNAILRTPANASMPLRYEFIDGVIRIEPKADITIYDQLVMYYYQTPTAFVEDGERAVIDGEVLLMRAEIMVKEHFGGQDTKQLRDDLTDFLKDKQGMQGDGDGFQMGGHQSRVGKTRPRNRFNQTGLYRTSWYDWRPW